MVVGLACGGQRRERAAVEAVLQCDDREVIRALLLSGVLAGGLDGALVGLRAGIAEEDLLHAGLFTEQLRQPGAGLGIVEIGHMLELAQLSGHGRLPLVVGNAEGSDADAAAHVDVFPAALIINKGPLAAHQFDREARIGIGDVFFVDGFQF